MLYLVAAPHRFTRQGQRPKAQFCGALDFLHSTIKIPGGNTRHRRHSIVVRTKHLPNPSVVHPALGLGELRIGRRPHRQALIRKDDLGVDAVIIHILETLFRVRPHFRPQVIFAFKMLFPQSVGPVPLANTPLDPIFIHNHARHTLSILGLNALSPQVGRFVGVRVGRHHKILFRIGTPSGALPALVAWGFRAPLVRWIDFNNRHMLSPAGS